MPCDPLDPVSFQPIGRVYSCFKEKFGIPRQPGLASAATAELVLHGAFAHPDCVRGLEECSHIWVLFIFSEHLERGWTPLVRPPRSGGKKRGVFATRSTFRPNPLGQSVVKLERIEIRDGAAVLHLSGVDLLDGTPVVDIKPYLPYADRVTAASYPYASDSQQLEQAVNFGADAEAQLLAHPQGEQLRQLIIEVLRCDPRPTFRRKADDDRLYGVALMDRNVRWRIQNDAIVVDQIIPQTEPPADDAVCG
ncbi:tRNA (N6-threonylcarbamoyladenosine(37)-N6)-methyltransferase TrmO [Motiliproteus sediminis]|uniref:tRNA (N6-threonylcarbamoyladenosine(37)-N6)-methyltransferase TrmO n=1 Tax=Motiliproteus sediminis TaxID=1468178 RepID=UPI0031BABDE9